MGSYVSCLTKTVKYEPSLVLSAFNSYEQKVDLEILEYQGMTKFISSLPEHFLDGPVKEFYETLEMDPTDGCYYAEMKVYTAADLKESSVMMINITDALRKTFSLPNEGPLPPLLSEADATRYKFLIKTMLKCWFGKLGSTDQMALPQKSLLAALMQQRKYNWKAAYLLLLMTKRNPPKPSEATKEIGVYWKEIVPISNEQKLIFKETNKRAEQKLLLRPARQQPKLHRLRPYSQEMHCQQLLRDPSPNVPGLKGQGKVSLSVFLCLSQKKAPLHTHIETVPTTGSASKPTHPPFPAKSVGSHSSNESFSSIPTPPRHTNPETSDLEILQVVNASDTHLKEIAALKGYALFKAHQYLDTAFPGLELYPEIQTHAVDLLKLIYIKTVPWPTIRDFLFEDSLATLIFEEEELRQVFGILSWNRQLANSLPSLV